MLSDRSIRKAIREGHLKIESAVGPVPLKGLQIQPISVDLRLGAMALRNGTPLPVLRWGDVEGWVIKPGQFLLGSTDENVGLSENLVGMVHGKSTIAREGLMVECAGLVDPGFHGQLTLELFNMTDEPITLALLQPICQLTLHWTDTTPELTYGQANNHYQGQTGPTPSWRFRI